MFQNRSLKSLKKKHRKNNNSLYQNNIDVVLSINQKNIESIVKPIHTTTTSQPVSQLQ
jgi:hypothetical protein